MASLQVITQKCKHNNCRKKTESLTNKKKCYHTPTCTPMRHNMYMKKNHTIKQLWPHHKLSHKNVSTPTAERKQNLWQLYKSGIILASSPMLLIGGCWVLLLGSLTPASTHTAHTFINNNNTHTHGHIPQHLTLKTKEYNKILSYSPIFHRHHRDYHRPLHFWRRRQSRTFHQLLHKSKVPTYTECRSFAVLT